MAEFVGWFVIAMVALSVACLCIAGVVHLCDRLIQRFEADGARKARESDGMDIASAAWWFKEPETVEVLKLIGNDMQKGFRVDANRIRERSREILRDASSRSATPKEGA